MNFFVNEILIDLNNEKKYRILWVDCNQIFLYLIELQNENAVPEKKIASDIKEAIVNYEWCKEKESTLLVHSIEYEKKHYQIRDKAWSIIEKLVKDEPKIFEKKYRSNAIKIAREEHQISYPAIRKYLYKYWSGGKSINTLLPEYNKSGGSGKEREAGEKKRGRPRKYQGIGINVDADTKNIFSVSIKKYYLTSKKNSLKTAYTLMIRDFYAKDIYYSDGIENVILKNEDEIPTYEQFKYWYSKEMNAATTLKARLGEKRYQKDHRAVLGTSQSEVFGPGSRYQIDATVGDVYLVSELNRNLIIGRPVIYLVVDVFSRLITGMHIGLEGPSWMGATLALINVVSNKKSFCKEYDIDISEEEWPCNYLPEILLADKGEFAGYNVERLITAFNMHVENTASFRADWKGIVENKFRVFQENLKPFIPGYIDKDYKQRGSIDYRLDAKLTLREFNQVMIKQIIKYNTKNYMSSYIKDRDMIADDVSPIPLELWNWGIQNRTGKLKYYPEDMVKIHLLPDEKATVNKHGISLNGITYSCEKALKENWFENARMKGSWTVNMAYDPRNMSKVYLKYEDGIHYEVCYLTDRSIQYVGLSLNEIKLLKDKENANKSKYKHTQLQNDVDSISYVNSRVKESIKASNNERDKSISKSEKVSNITGNRQNEKKIQVNNKLTESINKTIDESFNELTNNTEYQRLDARAFLERRKGQEYD